LANSTWLEATNEVLALSSLPAIASADEFDDTTGESLQKYHAAAKQFVKLAHMHLGVRARQHFNTERFQFQTTVNTAVYELDTGLSPEDIKFQTFFNVTTGTRATLNSPLMHMEYRTFKRLHPDLDQITTGAPQNWILLPKEVGAVPGENDTPNRIRIYPDPDDQYTIEFQAKLDSQPLIDNSSKILFPKHYEHVLWLFCWELLEVDLGEGKEGMLSLKAREAANQVWLAAAKHPDAKKAPRAMRIRSIMRGSTNFIRSPLSVDSNGTLLE
jgi:hypothetical protein